MRGRLGLSDSGFVDGQNVTIEYRWARGDYGRLPALAAELVQRGVRVILAGGERLELQAHSRCAIRDACGLPVATGAVS